MNWKTILILIISALLITFTIQNHIIISLKFLIWEITGIPVVLVLISGIVSGYLIAALIKMSKIYSLKRDLNKVTSELEEAKKVSETDLDTDQDVSMGKYHHGGFFSE